MPSQTISWQGGALTVLGAMSHTAFASENSLPASLSPFGGSGSFNAESRRPTSRSDSSAAPSPSPACASIPMPSATRRGVPNRLPRTGNACCCRLSNNNAGPPARSTRSHSSVISRTGETFCEIRRSSPIVSRRPTKSRRSLYFIWCGTGPRKRQKGRAPRGFAVPERLSILPVLAGARRLAKRPTLEGVIEIAQEARTARF